MAGKLFLIPCTLGEVAPLEVLPISVKKIIEELNLFVVENEKTARRFIKAICPNKNQSELTLFPLNKFTDLSELPGYLSACQHGENIGLISEAGCPGVADPGADLVHLAHTTGIRVVPLVGPSSILLALMASGMNGQNFAFHGYLPIDKAERKLKIRQLEKQSLQLQQAQIFIETPYRNNKLLLDLCQYLKQETNVCVACNLTLPDEFVLTQSVKNWTKTQVDLHKKPTIFIIQS